MGQKAVQEKINNGLLHYYYALTIIVIFSWLLCLDI